MSLSELDQIEIGTHGKHQLSRKIRTIKINRCLFFFTSKLSAGRIDVLPAESFEITKKTVELRTFSYFSKSVLM